MIGFFGLPHGTELIIVLVLALLLFGHRLPGLARSLGSGITEFKRGLKDGTKDDAELGAGKDEGESTSANQSDSPKA